MQDKLEVCIKDWAELADEYKQLELAHKEYRNVSTMYTMICPVQYSSTVACCDISVTCDGTLLLLKV